MYVLIQLKFITYEHIAHNKHIPHNINLMRSLRLQIYKLIP